jgi:heme exporter protein D
VSLGPHAAFILYAYALAFAILAALIGWVALDHRAQARKLKALEDQGVTRRSAGNAAGNATGNAT